MKFFTVSQSLLKTYNSKAMLVPGIMCELHQKGFLGLKVSCLHSEIGKQLLVKTSENMSLKTANERFEEASSIKFSSKKKQNFKLLLEGRFTALKSKSNTGEEFVYLDADNGRCRQRNHVVLFQSEKYPIEGLEYLNGQPVMLEKFTNRSVETNLWNVSEGKLLLMKPGNVIKVTLKDVTSFIVQNHKGTMTALDISSYQAKKKVARLNNYLTKHRLQEL